MTPDRPIDLRTGEVVDLRDDRPLVLVVEDDPAIAHLDEWVLEDGGYRVRTVESVSGARRALADERPAAIIVDVRMADESGLDLVRALRRKEGPGHPPVVLCTVLDRAELPLDVMSDPLVCHVAKPFVAAQLLDGLRRALAAARAQVT